MFSKIKKIPLSSISFGSYGTSRLFLCSIVLLFSTSVYALDGIIRPYQSVRSAAMGGVRMTTGLYDENFFNNPARVTANPASEFTLIQITPIETTSNTIKEISSISNGNDPLKSLTNNAGKNIHDRLQIVLPAFYWAATEERKLAFALGMITSLQIDADIRQSYQTSLDGILDIGPTLTIGRKFLAHDELSIGINTHLTYRVGTSPNFSLVDYVRGSSLGIKSIGGEGSMIDFDLGSTYKLGEWNNFVLSMGGAIQNILGGNYSNLKFTPLKIGSLPPAQPRSYGLGVSVTRSSWVFFTDTALAFEVTDIHNNPDGSVFKLLHLGGETHWKSFAFRAGLNQGYWTAGLGIDFRFITLDLASYGEEMGLNAGTLEDRRYTLNLGLHI